MKGIKERVLETVRRFSELSGLPGVEYELDPKPGAIVCEIFVANPTERLFEILETAKDEIAVQLRLELDLEEDLIFTLTKRVSRNLLSSAEGQAFVRGLAETLNVNRFSYEKDFTARYTPSVTGAEAQIISLANHVVFGRRGAGKSMLLLYALHMRAESASATIWLDLQVYSHRNDVGVITDVLAEVLEQAMEISKTLEPFTGIISRLRSPDLNVENLRKFAPDIRRALAPIARLPGGLFVFLDDFHVLGKSLQPVVLNVLYSIFRGNNIFLKLSAIESLTRTYDNDTHQGLQVPNDAQVITLDYNLVIPDKAISHIEAILDKQAIYSGLPSVRRICVSAEVLPRLTWVAAGVPRDALYLFMQAITKANQDNKKRVSVSNVNQAASETLSIKLKDLETDIERQENNHLDQLLERIRAFCISEKRKNAFLVEIRPRDDAYSDILTLVDLRLLHVINEGVTIGEAGRKYLALILDYGFYTGIRAARSVDLFNIQSEKVKYPDLRKLPVFSRSQVDTQSA